MNRVIRYCSGILAAVAFLAVRALDSRHSPLTDFTAYVLFPFLCLVFLISLFLVRIGRPGSSRRTRNIIRGLRVMAVLSIVALSIAIFWPRSYGTLPKQKKSGYPILGPFNWLPYCLYTYPGERNQKPLSSYLSARGTWRYGR